MVKAAVLVTVAPGTVDKVYKDVAKLGTMDVLTVTGRVDVVVFLEGAKHEVAGKIKSLFSIEGVKTTETLWEVEN